MYGREKPKETRERKLERVRTLAWMEMMQVNPSMSPEDKRQMLYSFLEHIEGDLKYLKPTIEATANEYGRVIQSYLDQFASWGIQESTAKKFKHLMVLGVAN
jgi:hypothetical protein